MGGRGGGDRAGEGGRDREGEGEWSERDRERERERKRERERERDRAGEGGWQREGSGKAEGEGEKFFACRPCITIGHRQPQALSMGTKQSQAFSMRSKHLPVASTHTVFDCSSRTTSSKVEHRPLTGNHKACPSNTVWLIRPV